MHSIHYYYIVQRFNVLHRRAVQYQYWDLTHIEAMDSVSYREGNSFCDDQDLFHEEYFYK
jgi:hypothetical protein